MERYKSINDANRPTFTTIMSDILANGAARGGSLEGKQFLLSGKFNELHFHFLRDINDEFELEKLRRTQENQFT